jgi:hypothetical protein
MSDLNNPTTQAAAYIRRLAAADPEFTATNGESTTVVNIEDIPLESSDAQRRMVLDLADGTTIRLDIVRYPTDPSDTDRTDKDWWDADYRILDASGQVNREGTEQVIADDEESAGYMAWCVLDGRTLDESGTGKVIIDAVRKV